MRKTAGFLPGGPGDDSLPKPFGILQSAAGSWDGMNQSATIHAIFPCFAAETSIAQGVRTKKEEKITAVRLLDENWQIEYTVART